MGKNNIIIVFMHNTELQKNNDKLKYPNFFIVGAPKCGTTSLHYWLSQHPEIFMSEPKEPRFFCSDLHNEADKVNNDVGNFFKYRNKEDYLDLFKEAKKEKILGEASVHYLYSKSAPLKIKKEIDNPKIIISLRDPVKFIQSYHSQILGQSENIKSLKKALNAEKTRIKGEKLNTNMTGVPSFLHYKKLAQFSNFVNYYFKIFDKKHIKIILLDDLRDRPKETYKEILKFLAVDDINFSPQFKVQNPNIKPRFKFLNNLLKKSNSHITKKLFQKIITKKYRNKIYYFILRINKKTKKRSKIRKKMKIKLKEELKPEIKKLSKITNRNLIKLWNYK